mmetsp:Transcript_6602/g.9766  ORF Transcript_6602/g.9766 Transcript_6602/m.9766 type:complete len:198 (-) Transcript_6602:32-625(-)
MNEEQTDEIEALNSIYPDILTQHSDTAFDIQVLPDSEEPIGLRLSVYYTQEYPNEPPNYSIKPLFSLSPEKAEEVKPYINDVIERDIGSPMIFDIIDAIKEWLNEQTSQEETQEAVPQEEKKTYSTFTPVTYESFTSWREAYFAEQEEIRRELDEKRRNQICVNSLTYEEVWARKTGKELFEEGRASEAEVSKEDME